MDRLVEILEVINELLKILFIAVVIFLAVTIFWEWLEFRNYGEIRPSNEDNIMALIITWLSVELYMCKKNKNKKS